MRVISKLVLVVTLLLASSFELGGQTTNATLSGAITDASGAVVAGAHVVASNADTNVASATDTNSRGIYTFASLPPGRYRLSVAKDGFRSVNLLDVVVHVQDQISQNFVLQVGTASESITVSGESLNINTSDASVSTVVDQSYVKNMPLNGRSFQDLILLTPGVVTQTPQNNVLTGNGVTGEFSVNGQRPEENYYTVDGVSANLGTTTGTSLFNGAGASGSLPAATALGTTQALVSVDDLQEFRIQSSTYSAEYGRNPGGQFAFETKSGNNQWHGTAYDYFRNDYFDAADYFTNYLSTPQNPLKKTAVRQNDFGGTLGGPVEIPHLYSGKDKTFFFFSYEGQSLVQPQAAAVFSVPDATLRASAPAPLSQVLNAFPVQNCTAQNCDDTANGLAQFIGGWSNPSSLDSTSVRFDHMIKDRTRIFFRFSNTTSDLTVRGGPPSTGVPASMKNVSAYSTRTYTAGASSSFANRLNNDFRLNYSSNYSTFVSSADRFASSTPVDLAQLTGLGAQSQAFVSFFLGSNLLSLQQAPSSGSQRQWNLVDTLSYSIGRHQLKFGVDYRRLTPFAILATPTVNYDYFSPGAIQSNTANFVLVGAQAPAYPLYNNSSVFAQDEWKATSRLNLSMGLRWEVNPPPGVTQGLMPFTIQGSDRNTWAAAPQGTPLWHTAW